MAFKVLVVDDSTFFRRRVKEILEQDPELTVIGDARNGRQAVEQTLALKPDIVTMDIEMPVLDGISAVREIMAKQPVPIMMFSSLTHEGATATLESLEAGALDFMPKNFEDIANNRQEAVRQLQFKVKTLGRRKSALSGFRTPVRPAPSPTLRPAPVSQPIASPVTQKGRGDYQLLAIGTSTGGPVALQTILSQLPANFPHPIVLVQHMPAAFTSAFAERLNGMCNIQVAEAKEGDILQPGKALLAPGGMQMLVESSGHQHRIKIVEAEGMSQITYKPSVDLTFASIARNLGGKVLALILTGMGADGREGCKALKAKGAKIWAQDEPTSVVYGMPQAVTNAGLAEKNLPLGQVADQLLSEMS